jgi:molybdopterin-dependent oxidoreductase-like protein protein
LAWGTAYGEREHGGDTGLAAHGLDATTWRLRLHGLGLPHEVTYTYRDLLRRELIERDITLTCVSNQVGGPYVGNARWLGVRLADLLREVGVRPPSRGGPADQLVSRSVDGMTIGSPVETVLDGRDAMLPGAAGGEGSGAVRGGRPGDPGRGVAVRGAVRRAAGQRDGVDHDAGAPPGC